VRVYDVGVTGEHAFVAMELIAGENLRHWLQAAPRKIPEIIDVFVQAGRGLAAAHAGGIVHPEVGLLFPKSDTIEKTEFEVR